MGNVIAEVLLTAKEQLDEAINNATKLAKDINVVNEVEEARNNFSNLKSRLDNSDNMLNSKRDKSVKINSKDVENLNLNNFDENTRDILQGLSSGTINAVLGDKNVKTNNIDDGAVTSLNTYLFEGTVTENSITVDYKNMIISVKANSFIFINNISYRISTSDLEIEIPENSISRAHLLVYNRNDNTLRLEINDNTFNNYDILICYIYNYKVYCKNRECIKVINKINGLHDIEYVVNNVLNNEFKNIKVKFIGDSITAGVGSTGYGLTTTEIGSTGKYIPLQNSLCWSNKLARRIEELYSNNTFILPSQITDSITSVFATNKYYLLRESKYYVPSTGTECFNYSFTGDSINIYFTKQVGSGIAGIYIDGNKIEDIDLYSATTEYNFKYEINGLVNGIHILSIKGAGQNASSSSRRLYIEALEIPKTVTCVNWGISGITTENIVNWKEQLIESDDDIVIMQIGTNDRAFNDVSVTLNNLRIIIDYIKNNNKELILCCATPVSKTDDEKDVRKFKMQRIVACISKIAKENNIRFINQYNYLSMYCKEKEIEIDTLLSDGLHPNDKCYDIMYNNACKEMNIAIE